MERIIERLDELNINLEKIVEQNFRDELNNNEKSQQINDIHTGVDSVREILEQVYLQIDQTNDRLKNLEVTVEEIKRNELKKVNSRID